MYAAHILLASFISLIVISRAENPSYDQGFYKPEFLNYCFEDREECKNVCGCMLDRKCMVRPIPQMVMETIVDKHNSLRKDRLKNEPKASGMPKLEYDAQLESIAQCWAAKCKNEKTHCLLTESYADVGMNVGMIRIEDMATSPFLESPYSDTKPLEELWKTIIDTWAKEIDNVQFSQEINTKDQADVLRGAQMVHDQTLGLGCSWSGSPEGSFFFCLYGPGIKNKTQVYKTGPPCTTCPPGLKCSDSSEGLCVKYALYPEHKVNPSPPHGGGGGGGYGGAGLGPGNKKEPPAPPKVRADATHIMFDMGLLLFSYLAILIFSS